MLAVVEKVPTPSAWTTTFTVACAPTARLPGEAVSRPLAKLADPWVVLADENETPAFSGTLIWTLVAGEGPWFEAVIV